MLRIILIAAMIHRPQLLVQQIYDSAPIAPLLAVCLVENEAWFNTEALNCNWNADHTVVLSSDWGLWQLNSRYHPQFREDLQAHIRYGAANFTKVLAEQHFDYRATIAAYNTGNPRSPKGLAWADKVLRLYEAMQQLLAPWGNI